MSKSAIISLANLPIVDLFGFFEKIFELSSNLQYCMQPCRIKNCTSPYHSELGLAQPQLVAKLRTNLSSS